MKICPEYGKQYKYEKEGFLQGMCRACLSDRKKLRYIFATGIPKMMETCAGIQVSEKDGLSPYICVTCSYFLTRFCTFKKRIEHSDQLLRNHLDKHIHKQKDIMDTAVSEAQIVQGNNGEKIKCIMNVNPLSGKSNEMQLEEQKSPAKQRAEIEIAKVKEEIKPEIDLDIGDEIFEHTVIEFVNANSQAFVAEPPPLVPLESTKKLDEPEIAYDFNTPLAAKPPPLIPIKPKVTDGKILGDLIQIPEIELTSICNSCNQQFMSVSALKNHKLTTCRDKFLTCTICDNKFRDPQFLIRHLKGHTIQKDYKCKICNKCYPSQSTIRIHLRTHSGEKPFKCKVCNKGFVRSSGIARHMKTHQVRKSFTCEADGKGLEHVSTFEHQEESLPFCCIYCAKKFSETDSMQLHITSDHTDTLLPFVCNKCGKCFASAQLYGHTWVHTGRTYKCKSCTKAFSYSSDLKNHERIHQHGDAVEDIKRLNNLFIHNTYNETIYIQ